VKLLCAQPVLQFHQTLSSSLSRGGSDIMDFSDFCRDQILLAKENGFDTEK